MRKKLSAVPPQPKAPAVESAAGVSLAAAAAADAMAAAAVTPKGLPVDKDEGVFLQRGAELKEEGNKAYNMRDMRTALALYEQALNLVPPGHPDRVALHNNRAAAHLMLRQFVDVIAECNLVLQAEPSHPKALLRRAKAYDGAGEYAKALQDLHALDASGADPGEDVASLKERLRLLSEAIPATAAPVTVPALVPASTAEVEAADGDSEGDAPLARRAVPVWTKLVLSDDIRLMPLPSNVTVADLGRAAARKFADEPGAAQLAVALPPDGSDGEPRAVVDDEALQTVLLEAAEASRPARVLLLRPDKAEHVENELEDWILDFAQLFRETLGIDAEAHLTQVQEGTDLCNAALEPGVQLEKAKELVTAAAAKYAEAAALALYNWGNVAMCEARRCIDSTAEKPAKEEEVGADAGLPPLPQPLPAETEAAARAALAAAAERYSEALRAKPDFHDAAVSLAQLDYERARLLCASAAGYGDEAEALFEASHAEFRRVVETVLPDEPASTPAAALDGEPASEPSLKAQVRVMHGNVLFEYSARRARAGRPWRPLLDAAVAQFAAAKCAQADIDNALASHAGMVLEKAAVKGA